MTLKSLVTNPAGKAEYSMQQMERISRFRWHIPSYRVNNLEKLHNKRANRYLFFRGLLISMMIERGEYKKAVTSFIWILRTSKSYGVYAFNKWNKGGYVNVSWSETVNNYKEFVHVCRTLPPKVDLKRIYIPKKNGKLRPLGIPRLSHRILNSAGAEFIYICLEDKIMDDQHGFRKGRGIYTAWRQIIKRTKDSHSKIGEFDLKSFFNTINPLSINQILSKIDPRISTGVQRVNLNAFPKFKNNELRYEEEFKRYLHDGFMILEKKGVPQGLPGSPLLASMVLSHTGFKDEDCIMYADDGIIFLDPEDSEKDLIKRLENSKGFKQSGIAFAPEKSGMVIEDLNFCGATLNLKTRVFTVDGKSYMADFLSDDELKKILGKLDYSGKRRKISGEGVVNPNSGLSKRSLEIGPSVLLYLKVKISEIKQGLGLKPIKGLHGYKTLGLKTYNYLQASTEACEDLLIGKRIDNKRVYKLKKVPKVNMLAAPLDEKFTTKNPKRIWKFDENTHLYLVNAPSYHYKGGQIT